MPEGEVHTERRDCHDDPGGIRESRGCDGTTAEFGKGKDVVGVVGIRTSRTSKLKSHIRIVTFRARARRSVGRGTTEEMKPQVILGLNDSSMIFDIPS